MQTEKLREIVCQEKILLGGDWNTYSNGWNPQCPPRRDVKFLDNPMDKYKLVDVTDRVATNSNMSKGETSTFPIDFFVMKASMADQWER